MKSVIFLASTLLILVSAHARGPGRAPAVEDFVGIESATPDVTPAGTQALFNFDQDVKDYQGRPQASSAVIIHSPTAATPVTTGWPVTSWVGIAIVLALPLITWVLTMRHLKTVDVETKATTTAGSVPDNVTPLRPKTVGEKGEDDVFKKAS